MSCPISDFLLEARYPAGFGGPAEPGRARPCPSKREQNLNDPDSLRPASAASDDRVSRLSAAILRINLSLELATVLKEAVKGARALTGARYGVITTIDERGEIREFVTSGLPPEERRKMVEWPDGLRLFAHLRDLPKPLRVADLPGYLRSLGLSPNPVPSWRLQGTRMHYRGEHLGNFFLSDKQDGEEFTSEDEEILVLFASQAATAIANARTHRDVERARADLAALIETSPVGVVVFGAGTGRAVSINREAQRIVEGLRTPGRPTEELLEIVTSRFADGREFSLQELPLARQFENAATLRAEEIELSVPDGRSVGRSSTLHRSARRRERSCQSWSRCRTSRRSRKSNGSGRSSSRW